MLEKLIDAMKNINFTPENVDEFEALAMDYVSSNEPSEEISICINAYQTYSMVSLYSKSDDIKTMYAKTMHGIADSLETKLRDRKLNIQELSSELCTVDNDINDFIMNVTNDLVEFSTGDRDVEIDRLKPAMTINIIVEVTTKLYALSHLLDSEASSLLPVIENKLSKVDNLSGLISGTINEVGIQGVTKEVSDQLLVKYWNLK